MSHFNCFIFYIITSIKILPYGDGTKERMVIELFTGQDYTDDIILWPDPNTGRIKAVDKAELKVRAMGIAVIKPKIWNNKNSATLLKWRPIFT